MTEVLEEIIENLERLKKDYKHKQNILWMLEETIKDYEEVIERVKKRRKKIKKN